MANITVDLLVEQGSLNTATKAESIGTDGCTMCVGLVAIMKDGTKFCAHFDCASLGNTPAQIAAIQAATLAALRGAIPEVPSGMSACTTANLNKSTGAIWAGIKEFFEATSMNTTNGIYMLANGEIGTVAGNNQVIGIATASANTTASIP